MVLRKSRKFRKNVSSTFSRRSNPNLNCTLLIEYFFSKSTVLFTGLTTHVLQNKNSRVVRRGAIFISKSISEKGGSDMGRLWKINDVIFIRFRVDMSGTKSERFAGPTDKAVELRIKNLGIFGQIITISHEFVFFYLFSRT